MNGGMAIQTLLIAAAAVFLAFRMIKQRTFRVNRLWIMPTLVVIVAGFGLSETSVSVIGVATILAGLVAGGALGFFRAEMSVDHVDVAARAIATKPNVWFAVLFAATFLLKVAARHGPLSSFPEATNFVMCLMAASVCAQRLQYYRLFNHAASAATPAQAWDRMAG